MKRIKKLILTFAAVMLVFSGMNMSIGAEGFDPASVDDAVATVENLEYKEQFSKAYIISVLTDKGFEEATVLDALEDLAFKYDEHAKTRAEILYSQNNSAMDTYLNLRMDLFTAEEAYMAVEKVSGENLRPKVYLPQILDPTPVPEVTLDDPLTVVKTAERFGCRGYKVKIELSGNIVKAPVDVALVLDASGSMDKGQQGETRLDKAKAAAIQFATKILGTDGIPNSRVSLIIFNGPDNVQEIGGANQASMRTHLITNLADLTDRINEIEANGGTNTQEALIKANKVMSETGRNANRVTILLTDGLPTTSNGNEYEETTNQNHVHITSALVAGNNLKANSEVYTIGITEDMNQDEHYLSEYFLGEIASDGGKYYSTPDATNLDEIFNVIYKDIDYIAKDITVIDEIGEDFEFIDFGEVTSDAGYSPDSHSISWFLEKVTGINPAEIVEETEIATLTYYIKAKDNLSGSAYTNASTTVEYIDVNNEEVKQDGFHEGGEGDFLMPTVDVPKKLEVTLSDATITRGTSISLGTGGYGGNLMTITGGTKDPTNDQRDLKYSWTTKDETEISKEQNPTVSPTVDTEYTVTIKDEFGCTATAAMMVFVRAPYVPPTPETIDVVANKVWVGGPEVKPTIELQLYRNDEVVDGRLATLENGTTTFTWNGLIKYDPAGVEYIYTVKEVTELVNYTKVEAGLTVTNTFIEEVERVDITGNKIWILGPEIKPVIELQLYRNGIAFGEPVELLDGTTSYTWTGLEKVDIEGNDYTYTVDEVSTPVNYDKLVSDDGLTVTNIFFEVAGDVVIDDTEKPPVDKTPPTGINNFGSLYTTSLVLGSAALFVLSKRKEEEF